MKKMMMASMLILGMSWMPGSNTYAAEKTPVDVARLQKDLMTYVDFLKKEVGKDIERLRLMTQEKGHDEKAYKRIVNIQLDIEKLQESLKKLDGAKEFPVKSLNKLNDITSQLKNVEKMIVSEAVDFPMKCKTLAVGGDIEMHKGIIEKFVGKWVLSFADDSQSDGLRRIHIDENVGTMGSAGDYALSMTPQDFYVEALVDKNGNGGLGIVRCISKPMKVVKN